jgi:hypothetical protein
MTAVISHNTCKNKEDEETIKKKRTDGQEYGDK